MVVFNHIPRTGGTFLIERLRACALAAGPRVRFPPTATNAPEVICDSRYRPALLVYHVGGAEFPAVYERRSGDVVFTFIRNRVDMVYSNFAYMKNRIARGDRITGWTAAQHRYFERPLEQHVENLLTQNGADRQYPLTLEAYDFVGVTEEMSRSLMLLGELLGVGLTNAAAINSVPCEKSYRRSDLERKFAPQLRLHAEAKARLAQLAAAHVLARHPA